MPRAQLLAVFRMVVVVALGARVARADDPKPPPTPTTPAPQTSLDKEQIRATVRSHLDEVRACRDKAVLEENPDFAGRIDVRFRIDPSGAVGDASVTSSTPGSKVAEACLVSAIKTWTFEKASAPSVIAYPFVFKPDDTPPLTEAEAAPFRRVVAEHAIEMRACWEQALPRSPTLAGKAKLRLGINPDGLVGRVELVASTLSDATVESCLRAKPRRWVFPKAAKGNLYTHVYDFHR